MRTTLALVVTLSVVASGPLGRATAQSGKLALTNDHATYGILGPTRADNKILPGDMFCLAFDIDNIKTDDSGRVLYKLGMEVVDGKGKLWYKEDPRDLEASNSLGGNQVPATAHVVIGLDQPPGEYTLRVNVTDLSAKTTATLDRKFDVLPREFGLVRLHLTNDSRVPEPVPAGGFVGQSIVINAVVVGFERDKVKRLPSVLVDMRVLDDAGKPTVGKNISFELSQGVPENVAAQPLQFIVKLNRPGKFTVKLKATDQVSKKTAELSFPLTVAEVK